MRVEINIDKGPRAIVNALLAAGETFILNSLDGDEILIPPPDPGNYSWWILALELEREDEEWDRDVNEAETGGEEDC